MLSIEITRECPLSCPGCYAYGDSHLGGGVTLSELSDSRGDELVNGVVELVRKHKPMHVSLVGGEPMVRHRELSRILPELARMEVFSLVVTSGVLPVPAEWMSLPRVRVAISVDGLPEHHDIRRKPATYERILKNIDGREVNIHWVITRPMMERAGISRGVRKILERPRHDESHLGERLQPANRRGKRGTVDGRRSGVTGEATAASARKNTPSSYLTRELPRRFSRLHKIRTSACSRRCP